LSDPVETTSAPPDPDAHLAEQIEAEFEARRKELGVADELKGIPGLTTLMLVAFGEQGIKTIADLAGCATMIFVAGLRTRLKLPPDTKASFTILTCRVESVTR
jgi:hypothetical protein